MPGSSSSQDLRGMFWLGQTCGAQGSNSANNARADVESEAKVRGWDIVDLRDDLPLIWADDTSKSRDGDNQKLEES
jgi:hypothetical protein